MIGNSLKIAFRSLLKNKTVFGINIIGLAIGIATCLTISLYVGKELNYDTFHQNANDIVRVVLHAKMAEENIDEAGIMAPVAATLTRELPEVRDASRIYKLTDAAKVTYENTTLRKGNLVLADQSIFDIFSFKFLSGDIKSALSKPNAIVLSNEQAKVFFGNASPLHQTINLKDVGIYNDNGYNDLGGNYEVTGVFEALPENSHFHFDMMMSMQTFSASESQSWLQGQYHTYLLLNPGTDRIQLQKKIDAIADKNFGPQIQEAMGLSLTEFRSKGNKVGIAIEELTDIHLNSNLRGDFEAGGDIKTVQIFAAIAIFMLLIACINFMNLSTASASERMKEIGIRKVLGSEKSQLILHFLTESFISTAIAMVVGVSLFWAALPMFNQLADAHISFSSLLQMKYVGMILGVMVAIGLLAGAYPAFFMSSFQPLASLKNKFSTGSSKGIRSGLVVFQFMISTALILGTIVVRQQMLYIQNKDIGYDRSALVVIRDAGYLGNKLESFKDEMIKDPRISNITTSAYVPAGPTDSNMSAVLKEGDPKQRHRVRIYDVDAAYIPTLGMRVIAGRNFDKNSDQQSDNVILNETAARSFGLPADPIGHTLVMAGDEKQLKTVVGVVKDFHARSLREPIEPLMMKYNPYYGLIMKVTGEDVSGLLNKMEKTWNDFGTGEAFQYAFLDDMYNETYIKESHMFTILEAFSLLTIFVACLGLYGLITFSTQQRVKEIGIRKTLGSSVAGIVTLLSKDYIRLIAIALAIGLPLGYYAMSNWLRDFEYRVEINIWFFVFASIATLLIALVTMSGKSIKAALANPVDSLKSE